MAQVTGESYFVTDPELTTGDALSILPHSGMVQCGRIERGDLVLHLVAAPLPTVITLVTMSQAHMRVSIHDKR
jgi:hypothetical protein